MSPCIRACAALAAVLSAAGPGGAQEAAPPGGAGTPWVIVVRDRGRGVDGAILWAAKRRIERARRAGVRTLVLEIETAGEWRPEASALAEAVRTAASDFDRLAVFAPREALGGGALLLLAVPAEDAFLGPDAGAGDILRAGRAPGPVDLPPGLPASLRSLARARGFPPGLAEALAYSEGDVVRLELGERRRYADPRDLDRDLADPEAGPRARRVRAVFRDGRTRDGISPGAWRALPEAERAKAYDMEAAFADRILYATRREEADLTEAETARVVDRRAIREGSGGLALAGSAALEARLAGGIAASREELLRAVGAAGVPPVVLETTWSERLVGWLQNPFVSGILLLLGLTALYVELKLPGFGLPGIAGLLLLGLYFGSHWIAGLADVWEIAVFAAGAVLLLVELFLIPGFGIVGFTGIALMIAGLVLTMTSFEGGSLPATARDFHRLRDSLLAVAFSGLGSLAAAALLARYLPRVPILRAVILEDRLPGPGGAPGAAAGIPPGTAGVAATDLRPSGKAEFGGRRVDALAEREFIPRGTPVRAVGQDGAQVVVRRDAT